MINMRFTTALLVLAACSAFPRPSASAPPDPRAQATSQAARAIAVAALCGEDGIAYGSGVVVGSSTALTALHVVAHCESPLVVVQDSGGETYAAVVTARWTADVARLELVTDTFAAPAVARGPTPGPGDEVCVVSAMPARRRRCGRVDGVTGGEIDHSAPVERGNSGGGVYDAAGRLVGITTKTMGDGMGGVATALEGLGA